MTRVEFAHVDQAENGEIGSAIRVALDERCEPRNAGVVCVGPILEAPDAYTPDLLGWMLRASHVADVVTLSWPGSRALLPGEHYHVLHGYDDTGFGMINAEGNLATTWTETDTSRRLQFFDIRIANACEVQSPDDEPAGWDVPHP